MRQLATVFFYLLSLLLLLALPAKAQERLRLSGHVTDANTSAALAGAAVSLKELPTIGAVTDAAGNYTLYAPAGTYTVLVKYIGYDSWQSSISLYQSKHVNAALSATSYGVAEVEITANRTPPLTETATMGQLELPLESLKSLPVLFGEADVLKTVQLLPGVKSGGEGNTGFYVRGGGADQNLVLLDGATVYNPGHLLNFFSVFNSDALESTTLIKGSMPARYGGRLSSVLDIKMKDGDKSNYKVTGGIGLISSRITLQGPIAKEKAAFVVSGRRTYMDALFNPFLKNTEQGGVPFYFYDLNGKLTYSLSTKDQLALSGYLGRDAGSLKLSDGRFNADFFWGNATATASWTHLFSEKLFMNLSAVLTTYDFDFGWDYGGFSTNVQTGVRDYSLNIANNYTPNVRHHVEYGLNYTFHRLQPRSGEAQTNEGENFSTDRLLPKYGHEAALYVSDDWNITDKLLLSVGLRSSLFAQVGPYNLYSFDAEQSVTDSVRYAAGQPVKRYQALEPRLAVRYELSKESSLKAGFTQSAQYVHLVSNAYTTLPLDVWVPSSALVKPQRATQYAAGYFRSVQENSYEASVELYYKTMRHQLEYREGYVPGPSNRDLEYEFVTGSGESYGLELFLRKNTGPLQGWFGYTLSRTNRAFPALNEGRSFPARYDRRHDLSLVGTYRYSKRWTLGGTFVYGTGQATTLPSRRYQIEGNVVYQYGDRNSFRMQPFHRLDLAATLTGKENDKLKSSWTFSVYNVYARQNPFLYYIDSEGEPYSGNTKLQAKKVSIIPFPLPSVTWNFTWL